MDAITKSEMETIVDSTHDGMIAVNEVGIVTLFNKAAERITGLSAKEIVGRPAVDVIPNTRLHFVLDTGEPELNHQQSVGDTVILTNRVPVRNEEGRIIGAVAVFRDISEIIALTEELSKAKRLLRRLEARYRWEDIIGNSPIVLRSKEQARMAAETTATVLLRGESGTGKELFADAIHNATQRRRGQFVKVNCAAIAESLLESELFGYEEGAFTGALKGGKRGLFEEANGGTIFLDEIGDISSNLQGKLLRVIQEKEMIRVGGTRPVPADARVIAATNADLEFKVHDKTFREDLYYRLNVMPIRIPSLRERKEDIGLLSEHIIFKLSQEFGRQVRGISDAALQALIAYDWPGNVRELENVLGRAMITMRPQDTVIELQHLPVFPCKKTKSPPVSGYPQPLERVVAEAEGAAIARALHETKGNRKNAAALLGISMRGLFYKMGKYGIK